MLIAILAVAPLDKHGDVSFILDKKKVENAPERMRVEQARYVGTDNKGQKFLIDRRPRAAAKFRRAARRHPGHVRPARPGAGAADDRGADRAATTSTRRRSRSTGRCGSSGRTATGWRRSDVTVDLKQRQLASAGPVSGRMRLGQFQAGQLQRRSRRADGASRRRRSLENRAGRGQMRTMRSLGILLATALAAATAALAQPQQPVSALKGHDGNAPVDVNADRIEVQDRADRAMFVGNVHVRQAELTLDTQRLTVAYSSNGGVQIRRLDAGRRRHRAQPVRNRQGRFRDLRPRPQADHPDRQCPADARPEPGQSASGWSSISIPAAR